MPILNENAGDNLRRAVRGGVPVVLRLCVLSAMAVVCTESFFADYRNQVFDRQHTGGHPVDVDASGQRGEVVEAQKERGEFRVLVLGDSISFGTGVAAASAWPKVLQDSAIHNRFVTCINAAMPGRSIKDCLADFRDHWSHYQPDLVLFGISNNMVALSLLQKDHLPTEPGNEYLSAAASSSPGRRLRDEVVRGIKTFALPSFLSVQVQRLLYRVGLENHHVNPSQPRGPMLAFGYQQADVPPALTRMAWSVLVEDLEMLRDECRKSRAPLALVTFPVRFQLGDEWLANEKCVPMHRLEIDSEEKFLTVADKLRIPAIDTGKVFRRELLRCSVLRSSAFYLHFDFTHFSDQGHRIIAAAVANSDVVADCIRAFDTGVAVHEIPRRD